MEEQGADVPIDKRQRGQVEGLMLQELTYCLFNPGTLSPDRELVYSSCLLGLIHQFKPSLMAELCNSKIGICLMIFV